MTNHEAKLTVAVNLAISALRSAGDTITHEEAVSLALHFLTGDVVTSAEVPTPPHKYSRRPPKRRKEPKGR